MITRQKGMSVLSNLLVICAISAVCAVMYYIAFEKKPAPPSQYPDYAGSLAREIDVMAEENRRLLQQIEQRRREMEMSK